jgi:predicted AAA+ superfamily ATPase
VGKSTLARQIGGEEGRAEIAMEIVRQAECAREETRIHHYRRGRDEVDLVLENRAGDLAAIEVKARASLGERDWRSLEKLRTAFGARFRAGFVIYTGESTVPLGDRLFAVPLSGLWSA